MPRKLAIVLVFLFLSCILPACATTSKKEGASSAPEEKSRASYYDFEDIQIPSELTLNKKKSFVYSTSRFKVGHLTFEGRVESDSLATFFQDNMPKNGWRPISTFKYREENMLVFLKEDRACMVSIKEKFFSTTLEIRMGPIDQASSQVKGSPSR